MALRKYFVQFRNNRNSTPFALGWGQFSTAKTRRMLVCRAMAGRWIIFIPQSIGAHLQAQKVHAIQCRGCSNTNAEPLPPLGYMASNTSVSMSYFLYPPGFATVLQSFCATWAGSSTVWFETSNAVRVTGLCSLGQIHSELGLGEPGHNY